MHRFFIKTPWIVKRMYPQYIWELPNANNEVYLTFDDGPTPDITPWVLEQLRAYNAKATFFCLGKNVECYPELYAQILNEGHAVGNHTFDHPNGWYTPLESYIDNIEQASRFIHSPLFRPPYGRIKQKHLKYLDDAMQTKAQVIMWNVLSCDFDPAFTRQQCLRNVVTHTRSGSIVVFHDSEKAFKNLEYTLPAALQAFVEKKFIYKEISLEKISGNRGKKLGPG